MKFFIANCFQNCYKSPGLRLFFEKMVNFLPQKSNALPAGALAGLLWLSHAGHAAANLPTATAFPGSEPWVTADSALAMSLLGLTLGVLGGIATFFACLILRERRQADEKRQDLAALFEALALDDSWEPTDPWGNPISSDRPAGSSADSDEALEAEAREPWERPADWWRQSE